MFSISSCLCLTAVSDLHSTPSATQTHHFVVTLWAVCVCVPHVIVPQSQSTGVLFPAERPHTPGPARRQHPAGQSSGRVAAEMQHPQPAGDTAMHHGKCSS